MREIEGAGAGEREKERASLRVGRRKREGVKGELEEDERMTILFFLFIPSRSPFLKEEVE